jgi:hypothetical protein
MAGNKYRTRTFHCPVFHQSLAGWPDQSDLKGGIEQASVPLKAG